MHNKISCFLPVAEPADLKQTIDELKAVDLVDGIYVMITPGSKGAELPEGVDSFEVPALNSTQMVKEIAKRGETSTHVLLYTKSLPLKLGALSLERMVQAAEYTGAGMIYSDYFALKEGKMIQNPVIDYQDGSLRDDFNFGSLLFFPSEAVKEAAGKMKADYKFAGLYDLRLKVSQNLKLFRLPEFLYTEMETDTRKSGEKIFDYVDPKNREVQIEMEVACTEHLKAIGGYLKPEFEEVKFDESDFPVEASVVVPVRNRAKTIEDAVRSVFNQNTSFKFNLIIVDNHSDDGTTEILKKLAGEDNRLIHVIPDRKDLGIGGCWNMAIMNESCGKFAIQLDSDDLYADDSVVQTIVDAFYEQNCAMVIGSYQMVNFKLEEIPPGLIDHKEWTPDNGRNNALRINGLGAPRAFYTPVLREIRVPNVSYGEDYAVGLAISRDYQIGRIYQSLYMCRRWDDNSDASLDIAKMNNHNLYKDRVRTMELWARIAKNKK
ncbi:glycosyltransferase family 2 protein [Marinilabilia rubra]|uniref:Glycosyl transferase n=1 Tax=Marinilabilia rubra TaxID=2162893 RepID=A0A2U2BDC7_9BACT|nr:glycosyltransferase family A protein [Marinilabilia rubra]PWE01075.1 glycosyl transferase [Marinilabilia rubra]